MQNVSFNTLADFFDYLPEPEQELTVLLRQIIYDAVPDVQEKLSFNVPFYRRHLTICFLWPASILWGKKQTYEGVRFGLVKGAYLPETNTYFEQGNRKEVCYKTFLNVEAVKDADIETISYFLHQAVLWDEQKALTKQAGKRRSKEEGFI